MKWIITISTVAIPVVLYITGKFYKRMTLLYNLLAILSGWTVGAIAANSVYEIIRDDTVFMTNIHAIFLNPYFLLSTAYLGNYLIYRLFKILFP